MLIIKGLKKKFNKNSVLKNINFEVNKGDRIAIIGPSGCGKSTLLRCINLLEKPSEGSIIFNNTNLLDKSVELNVIREKIGMVFQQFNLFNNLTVLENIILAPTKLGLISKSDAVKEAKKLLKQFDLYDKLNNYPRELSGGQKQRVAIIRTLIMNPDMILFDEPTSALDPEMVLEVEDLIKTIADENMTMIVVSHEMNFIKNIATKVIFMIDGEIVEIGDPDTIFNKPKDERLKKFINLTNK